MLLVGGCEGASATVPSSGAVEPANRFEIVHDRPLPDELRWAFDVRWSTDESVWIAAGRAGVLEVSVEADGATARRLGGEGDGPDGLLLAVSDGKAAAAVGFGPLSWTRTASPTATARAAPMAEIVDFDLWRDRAVFLGARRDEAGEWAPEGAILWAGSMEEDFADLEPRMYAESGPKALEVALCGALGLGAVRFFADGRYAVVPGVQPGAYLYAADGKLLRAWKTESLGFYDRCELSWDEARPVKADPLARIRWWRRHPTLEEVVPWGNWPALIVRRPGDDGTSWQLFVLSDEGISEPVDLPVATASTGSHLKADLRGDRLAVLISEFGPPGEPPQEPPRLVVLRRLDADAEAGER